MLLCNSIAEFGTCILLDCCVRGWARRVQYVINSFDLFVPDCVHSFAFFPCICFLIFAYRSYWLLLKCHFVYLHTFNFWPFCIHSNSFGLLLPKQNITNYSNGFFIRYFCCCWFFFLALTGCQCVCCICSTFSVASSISTACHFLIPCELIVCHITSHPFASSLAIPPALFACFSLGNRHSLRFNSMTNGMRYVRMLLN